MAHTASVRAGPGGGLVVATLSRIDFEAKFGPLVAMLEGEEKRREAVSALHRQHVEAFGLSVATRNSFFVAFCASRLPCGEVYYVRQISTGTPYTMRQEVKERLDQKNERQRLQRELAILRKVTEATTQCHGVLPTLLRAFETSPATSFLSGSGSVYLIFRQRAVCDLAALATVERFDEINLLFTAACVTQALDVLHRELNIVHRNVATDGIAVLEDGYVCLMDFRFARRDDGSCQTLCGPVHAYAPEQLRGETYGFSVDWWAMGTLLYELATGHSPWGTEEVPDEDRLKNMMAHTEGSIEIADASEEFVNLVNELLDPVADRRLGSSGVDGGGAQVREAAFFEDGVTWARLINGEEPSPLLFAVQVLQKAAVTETPPDDLPEGPPLLLPGHEEWLR
jgi:serine/threonine protein kinase